MDSQKQATYTTEFNTTFYRADEAAFLGVCKGLADRFGVDVLLIRLAYVFSVLFGGLSVLLYFLVAICIPRKSQIYYSYNAKLFGVCSRFARRFDVDPGLVRLFFVLLLFFTGGSIILGYFLLYFILPTHDEMNSQGS